MEQPESIKFVNCIQCFVNISDGVIISAIIDKRTSKLFYVIMIN